MSLCSLFCCQKLDPICCWYRPGEIPVPPTQAMEAEVELWLIRWLKGVTLAAGGAADAEQITHLLSPLPEDTIKSVSTTPQFYQIHFIACAKYLFSLFFFLFFFFSFREGVSNGGEMNRSQQFTVIQNPIPTAWLHVLFWHCLSCIKKFVIKIVSR